MPLRDPRPLARALVACLAVAVLAQAVRTVFRVQDFGEEVKKYDFLLDTDGLASDSLHLDASSFFAGQILATLLILPLQVAAAVLWVLWQRRLRRNAALLPTTGSGTVARRVRWVAAAGAAVFALEVGLYVAGSSVEDAHPIWSVRQVGSEVVLDLVVLAFMAIVAFTTFRWTGEQDRLARGTRQD